MMFSSPKKIAFDVYSEFLYEIPSANVFAFPLCAEMNCLCT